MNLTFCQGFSRFLLFFQIKEKYFLYILRDLAKWFAYSSNKYGIYSRGDKKQESILRKRKKFFFSIFIRVEFFRASVFSF